MERVAHLWSRFAERAEPLWKETHTRPVCELYPMGRAHTGEVQGSCLPWEGEGKGCSPWAAAETTCDELTKTTIPISLCLWGQVELGRRYGWGGEGVLEICFTSYYIGLILIGNKLSWFPRVKSVLPVMVISEGFLSVLNSWTFYSVFSPLSFCRGEW